MNTIRIMPCLDMKEGRVVKGVHFVDLKDAGDPVENALFYQEEGADELAMLDIAATLENRKTRLEWVRNVSSGLKIPLTVGGGISTLDDIEKTLEAGAAKISMNSAAVRDPDLVRRASERFGADRVTVVGDNAIDVLNTIIGQGLVTRLDHAGYLGRELQKAEIALRLKRSYSQDEPL